MASDRVSFLVKEVYFPSGDVGQTVCTVSVGEEVFKLDVKLSQPPFGTTVKEAISTVSGETAVQIDLFYEDHLQASADFKLSEFFPSGLRGDTENWILLLDSPENSSKSEEYTQIKLWMGFPAPPPPSPARICPYLSKLESVFRLEQECKAFTQPIPAFLPLKS